MSWRVVVRPEAADDVVQAAEWYDAQIDGLGSEFIQEILQVLDSLALNPLQSARRHPRKNIRWRYPNRFPYRVVYEVVDKDYTIIVAAVLHAARHERHWQERFPKGGG